MQDAKPARRIPWYSILLHLALVALSAQIVVLTSRAAKSKPIRSIAAGDSLKPIAVRDLAGDAQTLDFADKDRDTLLLVFTTSCPACQENVSNWVEVYERFHERFDVVGISVDEPEATQEYIVRNLVPYPVVVPTDVEGFPRRYGIPAVPHTLWLSPAGTVRQVWGGILSNEQIDTLAEQQADLGAIPPTLRNV